MLECPALGPYAPVLWLRDTLLYGKSLLDSTQGYKCFQYPAIFILSKSEQLFQGPLKTNDLKTFLESSGDDGWLADHGP